MVMDQLEYLKDKEGCFSFNDTLFLSMRQNKRKRNYIQWKDTEVPGVYPEIWDTVT